MLLVFRLKQYESQTQQELILYKINPSKTAAENLLDMINTFASHNFTGDEYTLGAPSTYIPTEPETSNTVFTLTALNDTGFSGSINIRYRRLAIGQTFVDAPISYDVVSATTRSQLIAQIVEEHGLLESEVTFTGLESSMPAPDSSGNLICTANAGSYFYTGSQIFTVNNTDAAPYVLNEYFGENVGALYGTPEQPIPEGVPIYVLTSTPYGTTEYNDSVQEFLKNHLEETYPGLVVNNVETLTTPLDNEYVRDEFGADMTAYGDTSMSGVFNSSTDPEVNHPAFICWDRPNFSDAVLNTPFTIATEVETLEQIFKYYIARMYNLGGLPPHSYTITGSVPAGNGLTEVISININEATNWLYRPAVAPIEISVTKNAIALPPDWVYPTPVLGFNDTGVVGLEAPRGEYDRGTIVFKSDGTIDIGEGLGGTISANAPTAWITNGPIPGAGDDFEIQAGVFNIDIGPQVVASIFGEDVTFESSPYETAWYPLSSNKSLFVELQTATAGGTIEGVIRIRNVNNNEIIEVVDFDLFAYPVTT